MPDSMMGEKRPAGNEKLGGILRPRCLIIMDTEGGFSEKAVEVHCLITEDTVANGKIHEPIHPRRIP